MQAYGRGCLQVVYVLSVCVNIRGLMGSSGTHIVSLGENSDSRYYLFFIHKAAKTI